jgi:adenine/guanine phosphoribosyltransferase-like PRPP-binding protein
MVGILSAMTTANVPYLKGWDLAIGATAGAITLAALIALKLIESKRMIDKR